MEKRRFTTLHRFAVLTVFLFSTVFLAHAQTFLGTAGDGLWSNVDNWLDGLKPDGMFCEVTISANVNVDEDVSIGTLYNSANYSITILSGKTLIINSAVYLGNLGLILEDKAELVYREPVPVKIKKKIKAFNEDNHLWNLIASPVHEDVLPSTENGFLTDPETGYALYSFDENTTEWINYKTTPFALENGKSYLYANALDTTVIFEGTTVGYNAECPISFHANNGVYAGCNFIGNPLPCDAFIGRSYYIVSEESNSLIAVAKSAFRHIAPCEGIIVNSSGPDDTEVLFSYMPIGQYTGNHGSIEITVAKSDTPAAVLDQALLSFNAGDDLAKFALFEKSPLVFFTKDNKDLAILSVDSVDVQPLKFKAEENSSYTMHFEPKDLDLNYMHLIDNRTGANIDLLNTPNYTFSATTNDYSSRFKLIFDPHYNVGEYENDVFAYYANGEIVINDVVETQNFASLQIIDMMGRIVVSIGDVSGNVSTIGIAPGVYMLRLNTSNGLRTQKMVIE